LERFLGECTVILVTGLSSVLVDVSVIDEIDLKTSIIEGCEEVGAAEVLSKCQETDVFALVEVPLLDEVLDLKRGIRFSTLCSLFQHICLNDIVALTEADRGEPSPYGYLEAGL